MPELPEVEVVRATLEAKLCGKTIVGIDCYYQPIIEEYDDFISHVLHQTILEVRRFAKYLIFVLKDGAIISHLRMEGKYFYTSEDTPIEKHQHVVFHFENGEKLIYQDVRKFGRMVYRPLALLYTTPPLSCLGIEANNPSYDIKSLYKMLHQRRIPIKTVLLDQSFISGLGNIYVDEVLCKSHISPLREANQVSLAELESILKSSQSILSQAIEHKGTTIRSYTSSLGVTGNYQSYLLVHTKTNCPFCKNNLTKVKIGGRTSYFCKNCQR